MVIISVWRLAIRQDAHYITAYSSSTAAKDLVIQNDNASQSIGFYTGGSNSLQIRGDGKVGIGTTSPGSLLNLTKTDATAYSSTATDGQIGVGPTLYLNNPANANNTVGGQIVFGMRSTEEQARIAATGGVSPALTFNTADVERVRIDGNGHIFSGTTSNFPGVGNTNTGFMLENASDGRTAFLSRNDNVSLYLNRNTDGTIVRFHRKWHGGRLYHRRHYID